MKKLFTLVLGLCIGAQIFAQVSPPAAKGLKGNGQVFFLETFGWENPADPKGWTAPTGFYMEDPENNGMNWHWWGNDSLIAQWVKEPPMQSTTAANGSLTLFADKFNEYKVETIQLNNSIVFPPFDCSSHSSVIVRYETVFMNYENNWQMLLEVSTDNWVHSATFDVGFGCLHKGRPNNTMPGIPAVYEGNISEVAAGQSNVLIKFTWKDTDDYFWQIDDFTLSEAWDNDLQMKYAQMEWDDKDVATTMTPFFMIPKSQLAGGSFTNFKSALVNFGEFDQTDVYLDVEITKNSQSVFHKESPRKGLYSMIKDTVLIPDSYTPVDFGHYKIAMDLKQNETEQTPQNNQYETYFNVTDSVYSHADNTPEQSFCWGFDAYGDEGVPNNNHKVGVQYKIYGDCEVNSISAYIAGGLGDGKIDFRYGLYAIPAGSEDQTPVELMLSESVVYDSTMIGKWITLPLSKDGESEFLKEGDLAYAVVEYNNQHTDVISKRYENLKIGADLSFRILDAVCVGMSQAQTWITDNSYLNEKLLMIRLNINDNSNLIDGVDLTRTSSSIGQNYPNPFNRSTDIAYELANDADVSITVMDLTGRMVMNLKKGFQASGKHTIRLDASGLDAGVYFYTIQAGSYTQTKRMTVAK
jgi:hypothetical protein